MTPRNRVPDRPAEVAPGSPACAVAPSPRSALSRILCSMLHDPVLWRALLAVGAFGGACSLLSVLVVLRRWAFIGEGIAHGAFGGAGTVWILAAFFPAVDRANVTYAGVIVWCLIGAIVIGYLVRRGRLNADAAIGIFLAASLAWGFLAQAIYLKQRHLMPAGWGNLFLGRVLDVTTPQAIATAGMCAAVIGITALLGKEILFYCLDPAAAHAAGVRAGFIHYLLLILVSIVIMVGAPLVGALLVTAMLILPGAAAMLLSARLQMVLALSISIGMLGAIGGLIVVCFFPFCPAGPAIVLVLIALFSAAYAVKRVSE